MVAFDVNSEPDICPREHLKFKTLLWIHPCVRTLAIVHKKKIDADGLVGGKFKSLKSARKSNRFTFQ